MAKKKIKKIKYPRSRRSEVKGWIPTTLRLPDGISPKDIDRMEQKVREILSNNHIPSESELTILGQVRLLCRRVKAFEERDPTINQLSKLLAEQKDVLHKKGFREKRDIVPLNLWVTRKIFLQKGGIEELLQQVEGKIREVSQK